MDDRQELIRRMIDGELSADEERQLERRAEEDPELGLMLRRARSLRRELQKLPPVPDPGPGLTDRIMESIESEPRRGLLQLLLRPVPVPLWATVLIPLLVILALWSWRAPPAAPPAPLAQAPTECPPPATVMVRFVLKAPEAKRVHLAGDFNDWSVEATPLADPDGDGFWSVLLPLKPGRYQYKFLLDGERWIVEPDAPAYQQDGFGGRNSLLVI